MEMRENLKYRHKLLLALKIFTENAHEIIDLVFQSKDTSDCVEKLSKHFDITAEQAQVIADIQVHDLLQLRRESLEREITEVEEQLAQ